MNLNKINLNKINLLIFGILILFLAACTQQQPQQNIQQQTQESQKTDSSLVSAIKVAFNQQPYNPPLPDHLWAELGDGSYMFLHFDKPVPEATKVLWVGIAIPGRFCSEEQSKLPYGFTHFHRETCSEENADLCHGGKANDKGHWLKHVAVRSFDAPWGRVNPGIDINFMPTKAPSCV